MAAGYISTHAKCCLTVRGGGGWAGGNAKQPSRETDRQAESRQESAALQLLLYAVCERKSRTLPHVSAAVCFLDVQHLYT